MADPDIYVININQVGPPICGVPDNYRISYYVLSHCGQALPPRWAEALPLQQTEAGGPVL